MLNDKQLNVLSEIFNISFSKFISRLSLLINDRLDISVPKINNLSKQNIDNMFSKSNLIFNELNGIVNIINGELNGNYFLLIESNSNLEIDVKSFDNYTINQVFIETVSNTLNSILKADINFQKSKEIQNIEKFWSIFDETANQGHKLIYSRWSSRSKNFSGYAIIFANVDSLINLPKFLELMELS